MYVVVYKLYLFSADKVYFGKEFMSVEASWQKIGELQRKKSFQNVCPHFNIQLKTGTSHMLIQAKMIYSSENRTYDYKTSCHGIQKRRTKLRKPLSKFCEKTSWPDFCRILCYFHRWHKSFQRNQVVLNVIYIVGKVLTEEIFSYMSSLSPKHVKEDDDNGPSAVEMLKGKYGNGKYETEASIQSFFQVVSQYRS